MAERAGFEPAVHLWGRTHDFQSCSFSRSDISPQKLILNVKSNDIANYILAERGGFEPPWELVAPKSISSRSRYDHFGTSPRLIKLPKRSGCYPLFLKKSTDNFAALFL